MGPINRQAAPTIIDRWTSTRWYVGLLFVGLFCVAACAGPSTALRPIPRPATPSTTPAPSVTPIARALPAATASVIHPTVVPASTPPLRPTASLIPTMTTATSIPSRPTPEKTAAPLPSLTAEPTQPVARALTVSRGPTAGNAIALTFDAGADRGEAAQLLAYLEENGINVTFGMTGRWAENNPDLVRRIVADGDRLMNHTYDHLSLTGKSAKPAILTLQGRIDEIEKTDSILEALTGVSPKPFFRPPYGDQDPAVLQAVAAAGYHYSVLWTVDSLGWRGLPASQIVDRCLRLAVPGAIYVLHVGAMSQDIEATPAIVAGLRARGFRFVTLDELLVTSVQ